MKTCTNNQPVYVLLYIVTGAYPVRIPANREQRKKTWHGYAMYYYLVARKEKTTCFVYCNIDEP